MTSWLLWGGAAALYVAFRAWYDNWRGPLRPEEIDALIARAGQLPHADPASRAAVREFLLADDGREFVMFNIVKTTTDPRPDPRTGEPVPGNELLQRYVRRFVRALVARGGHPLLARRKIAGYVDSWAVAPDPGWSVIGLMRYRSRRDLIEMVLDPRFGDVHLDKVAGTLATFSFPTAPMVSLVMGPRLWVALVLALAAALGDLVV
ncbi:hypothetical protein [Sphingomonas sp.]|uniref:hypothetical protein n=1 Tax=Sphingomonas sp. TaxID=28214 RepID=UPI001D2BB9EB|nr:hypothetical protein [Sphingomonas sp.]MBX9795389.1 hypothetical protein [Sphingomonas sp.]